MLARVKRMGRRGRLAGVALGATFACGLGSVVVERGGAKAIVAADRVRETPRAVVLVLAGGVRGDRPSPLLEDRLETALDLFRGGAAPRLLISGDHRAHETQVMRKWLLDRGVRESALVVDEDGVDTYSSMARARTVFRVESAIIVTQRFHLPRALYIAQALGLPAVGVEAREVRYTGDVRHPVREFFARLGALVDVARGRPSGA